MGFFSSIKKGFWELVNPTKKVEITNNSQVEVARIESESKERLAEMDKERVEDWRNAQLEIVQAQALTQIAIDKARAEGMTKIAEQLVNMQQKMLDVATKQIAIIETTSLPIIKDIEKHYDEIGEKISAQRDEYNRQKLPELLTLLEQFPEGTPKHTLFMEQIRNDMAQQNHFIITQIDAVQERQTITLENFLKLRGQTMEQIQPLLQQIATSYLPQGQATSPALPSADIRALPPSKA